MIPQSMQRNLRAGETASAFERGPQERPLRVVLDSGTLRSNDITTLLLSFGSHTRIRLFTTIPAEGMPAIEYRDFDPGNDQLRFTIPTDQGRSLMAVCPAAQYIQIAQRDAATTGRITGELVRAAWMAATAQELRADALATNDIALLPPSGGDIARGANTMSPGDALALIGLHCRVHDDFPTGKGVGFNRGPCYWVTTRELLPAGWPWLNACVQNSLDSDDDTLLRLGQATLTRVDRALRARDRMHEQLLRVQNNDTADEAVFYLDVFLLMVVGAFDAAARVAHLAYALTGDRSYASWRRRSWRDALRASDRVLAEMMDNDTPHRDALEAVALLRNSIHGEALTTIAYQRAAEPLRNLVELSATDAAALQEIADRHGGEEVWGIQSLSPGKLTIDAARYIETVMPLVMKSLDTIMSTTDMSRLPGTGTDRPMEAPTDGVWDPSIRRNLRLLFGL